MLASRLAVLALALAVWPGNALMGQDNPPATPGKPPARSPFADVKPESLTTIMKISDLLCDWFDYPVTHGGGNFQPVFLPFDYTATVREPDLNQSYVFPHLLSTKMDWIPDNTCTRHPYFVFKRWRELVSRLHNPTPAIIAAFMKGWQATHAIGGALRETPEGWSGSLVAYGPEGLPIVTHEYPEPRDYFKLMSDMTLDMFAFRGYTPSPELKAELERPLTKSKEALRVFGKAALVWEKSGSEWALYEEALSYDPDFAEARYWYANQKTWETDNWTAGYRMRAQALKSHIVFSGVTDFHSGAVKDEETARIFTEAVQRALKLAPENPNLVLRAAKEKTDGSLDKLSVDEVARLEQLARRYPANGSLLYALACWYWYKRMPERAIPLDLSAALSGYVFSLDMCADAWRCAGVDYGSWAGDWKRALYCAGAGLREQPEAELAAQLLSLAGKSLEELCRFEEASRMRKAAYERSPSPQRLVEWVQCLYEGGFPDEALKLQDKFKENIEKDAHLYQVRALRKIYGDDPGGGMQIILDNAPYGKQTIDDAFILWIGAYILNAEDWRFNFERELMSSPSKRRGWILLDLWEKRKRTDISSYFYETSTWLHTDDAYFAQARDEFNKVKTGPEPQPDPAHILEVLKKAAGMPRTEAWILICNEVKPMLVEWNIKRLLEAGDFDMAEQIASAYEVAGPDQGNMDFKSWIHVLLRRVLAARQRSSLPAVESPAMQESGVK